MIAASLPGRLSIRSALGEQRRAELLDGLGNLPGYCRPWRRFRHLDQFTSVPRAYRQL
jgi:hypothetical protein